MIVATVVALPRDSWTTKLATWEAFGRIEDANWENGR
jgi:hypothetical protein